MQPRRPTAYPQGDPADSIRRRSGYYQADDLATKDRPALRPNLPPFEPFVQDFASALDESFAAIDLTPRILTREPSHSSMFSHVTGVSQMSRLPTPDFTTVTTSNLHSTKGTIRSYLHRGLSFVTLPIQPSGFLSRQSSSLSSSSKASVYSSKSTSSRSSTRTSGHGSLFHPSVCTTDKFTSKWPRPKSLKRTDSSESDLGPDSIPSLADTSGMRMDTLGRWNKFKWILLLSILLLFAYSSVLLAAVMSTWFRTWELSDVVSVANNDILVLATVSASVLLITFVIGLSGLLLNSRPILAVYCLLLWPSFTSVLVIGYVSYKRSAFVLDRKLQRAWSQDYTQLGRLMIQNSLRCCGWFNALHQAAVSNRCYPRTSLPGCKAALIAFEKAHLGTIWRGVFGLIVPMHIMNIFAALLCSNHVNDTFGKGIMPKKYRLTAEDVKKDKEEVWKKLRQAGSGAPLARPLYARAMSSRTHREDKS